MEDRGAVVLVDTVTTRGTDNDLLFLTDSLNLASLLESNNGSSSKENHVIVIVDDNSGSMSSYGRKEACIKKSQVLIAACSNNTSGYIVFSYSTFGSRISHHGSCSSEAVQGFLNCSEGTQLILLARSALEAAEKSCRLVSAGSPFRLFFVLNTDGEASDGVQAGSEFLSGYHRLRSQYPAMLEARSFVLGIGKDHDEKVLASMSVGQASYFNYPDTSLDTMVTDVEDNIIPEICKTRTRYTLTFNSGRYVDCVCNGGIISLGDIRVFPSEISAVLTPGNVQIAINTASPRIITQESPMFFELLVKNLELDALELAKSINSYLKRCDGLNSIDDSESPVSVSQKLDAEEKIIRRKCSTLVAEIQKIESSKVIDSSSIPDTTEGLRQLARSTVASAQGVNVRARRTLYEVLKKLRNINDPSPSSSIDARVGSIISILDLCIGGIRGIKLGGQLARDIERDYMELLGTGGFKHWTNKKKNRLVDRALDQANSNAVVEADKAVSVLFSVGSFSLEKKILDATTNLLQLIFDRLNNQAEHSPATCWFTMMTDAQLAAEGDVLCIAGFVPAGARNLPLCSVSSALVLNGAIMRGQISVCPEPMSFLCLRSILEEGHFITRGPHGLPINAVFYLLPTPENNLSVNIARIYAAISTSQLLTSRWIYTTGCAEYRNGALSALMTLLSSRVLHGEIVLESELNSVMKGILSFYQTYQSSHYMNELIKRARDFITGSSTSGEVPTMLVAIADQMLLSLHEHIEAAGKSAASIPISRLRNLRKDRALFQILFMRLLRDSFSDVFTAFVDADCVNGNELRRQKELEADFFIEVLIEGLNFKSSDATVAFIDDLGWSVDVKSINISEINIDSVSLSEFGLLVENSGSDCDFNTFFDVYEMEEPIESSNGVSASSTVTSSDSEDQRAQSAITGLVHFLNNGVGTEMQFTQKISTETANSLKPRSLRAVVQTALHWQTKLDPISGAPGDQISDSDLLSSISSSNLSRDALMNSIIAALQPEIDVLVRFWQHLEYQDALCRHLSSPDAQKPFNHVSSNLDFKTLLNFEDEFLVELIAICIRSIKLRTNNRYRAELMASDGTKSLLVIKSPDVISQTHSQIQHNRVRNWEIRESLLKEQAKSIFRRMFLSHPKNLAPLPLVILNRDHLAAINVWLVQNRGFEIIPTVSPITDDFTGMASNTFLTPKSRYFMEKNNPYEAQNLIFGTSSERLDTFYCEHLHTFCMHAYLETSENQGESYASFERMVNARYGESKFSGSDLPSLWISMIFKHSSSVLVSDIPKTENFIRAKSAMGITASQKAVIIEEFLKHVKWITDPASYLDEYFSQIRESLELTEFLDYLCRHNIISRSGAGFVKIDRGDAVDLASEIFNELSGLPHNK